MEITRETLISEVVENCPQAMPAFQAIGMHCMGCAMWRKYGEEALPKNKGYMVYRCEHGHKLLIPLSSDPNTQDLNEILVENSDGSREKLKYPNGF